MYWDHNLQYIPDHSLAITTLVPSLEGLSTLMLFPEGMTAGCLAPSHVLALRVISAELRSEGGPGSRSGTTGRDHQAQFLLAVLNLWGPFWSLEPLEIEKLRVHVQWRDWQGSFS